MRKIFSIFLFVSITKYSFGQDFREVKNIDSTGIYFERGLSWKEIQVKAKSENKYIFLDFFATWCLPCKKMDTEIYSNDTVGRFMNGRFIAVKVQIDTGKLDSKEVRNWYEVAHEFLIGYRLYQVPTYLFFSPDGHLVHRGTSFLPVNEFISLASDALLPEKQYYTLLNSYNRGVKDIHSMKYLSATSSIFGFDSLSKAIAKDCINNYLLSLHSDKLYNRDNIEFITSKIDSSNSKSFTWLYNNVDKINKTMGEQDYAQKIIGYIINRDLIAPQLWNGNAPKSINPDWGKIVSVIARKYGKSNAERAVISAKLRWYKEKKDWVQYTANIVKKVDTYGPFGFGIRDLDFNNDAWEVFKYSFNKQELYRALSWSDSAIKINPTSNWMDTYANILYKLAENKKAIDIEIEALKISPDDKEIQTSLENMKKGKPTWPISP